MRLFVLLLLAAPALADRGADLTASEAMREYYLTLRGAGGSITAVRDKLVPVLKDVNPKTRASVIRVINQGFEKKYGKDLHYHTCLAEILAAGGKNGISMAYKRYKGSKKKDDLREAIATVLGNCGDPLALGTLMKIVPDKSPAVAAAAVTGCASYAKAKEKKRKETMKKLVAYYLKVTNHAAKGETQRKMYKALKPAMNETLKAFSGGESLDSAEAWDAWLRENITKPWTK